jgi:metalloendopeptidase OMA1, mitochondrial
MLSRRALLSTVLAGGTLTLTLIACTQVDGTGRRQLLLTSAAQENQLGAQAYAEIRQQEKPCTDAATVAFVTRVGQRVAAAAPDKGFTYEFTVLDSDTINAFCLPGGKVAVYTGILPLCANEAGLAAVLGHEIAHAIARHGGERMSQQYAQQIGGVTLAAMLEAKGVQPTTANLAMTAYGVGSQIGVMLPYSRNHELEADRLGLMYMAKAGYDPQEAVAFWQRFAGLGNGGTPGFLSTHPASDDRARALTALLPEARTLYEHSSKFGAGAAVPIRAKQP